jgi:hypothetical protein
MKVTLTHEEITDALMDAIVAKTKWGLGPCSREHCSFTAKDGDGNVVSVCDLEFTCDSF